MPLGLPAVECPDQFAACSGGGGWGGYDFGGGWGTPGGVAWAVRGLPVWQGYSPVDNSGQRTVSSGPQPQTQAPVTITTQQTVTEETAGSGQQAAGNTNWIVPVLTVIAALAMSR